MYSIRQEIYLIILHYIFVWAEICHRIQSVKNNVHWLISVFSWLVVISKFAIFLALLSVVGGCRRSYSIVGSCFTDVMIHRSVSFHQMDALHAATEPRRLYKNVSAACGAVMVRLRGVSNAKDMILWSARSGSSCGDLLLRFRGCRCSQRSFEGW